MFPGTTNENKGDMGYMFRTQAARSMTDLDNLYQYKQSYANYLGAEKTKQIEANLNAFEDADQFRIYHAVGRFRGTICATIFTGALFSMICPQRNGMAMMAKRPYLAVATFVGSWNVFYQLWSRQRGYSHQKFAEFQYARVHKQLRNAQVKQ